MLLLLNIRSFDFVRQAFVAQISQQLGRFGVQTAIDHVHEQRGLLQILQVDVVDVANVGQAMVFRVLHTQDAIDDFSFGDCVRREELSKKPTFLLR